MGWLKSFKRTITGEVVRVIEVEAGGGWNKMSFRLKRERKSGEHYVVLTHNGSEGQSYIVFDREEFAWFAAAAEQMAKALKEVG